MPEIVLDGATFHIDEWGSGRPLVLLHGFTGSTQTWAPLAEALARKNHVVAIDIIGHGLSDAGVQPDRFAFERALDDLAGIADALGLAAAAWLGYSMGGRLALGLALRHPSKVAALVLESASPGIADATDRATRRATDIALAARIENEGVASFVEAWERRPMWSSQHRLPPGVLEEQRAQRLRNRASGLAGCLRGMSTGAQPSFWARLHEIHMPALIVAGDLDAKFAAIARDMHDAMPASLLEIVADAGHAVHLEQPETFASLVVRFLEQTANSVLGTNQEGEA